MLRQQCDAALNRCENYRIEIERLRRNLRQCALWLAGTSLLSAVLAIALTIAMRR